jgi:hypothetical protein
MISKVKATINAELIAKGREVQLLRVIARLVQIPEVTVFFVQGKQYREDNLHLSLGHASLSNPNYCSSTGID